MANMINMTIDGKECTAKEGEFILNVARANDIFVPAICYQTKCSPTLACRLCLVEADGKQVYACNAKSKDGMSVTVDTPNIEKERKAIMEVYDVNHPLQCGVCDKSGECELQNYTLYMNVDKQNYSVKDVDRPTVNWGVMNYDPGLCIVCEKCVTVCKDMIGSNALSTVKRGADALSADYKANMPKDAYAMWNKLNKNLIGFDEPSCIDCGECIEVCPVGALVSSEFQYRSNAWELTKIPAANPYSSDCSFLYYEVKHESIDKNTQEKIYRVTNESHYSSLSGATRFAFDYSNRGVKDDSEFLNAVEKVQNADSILFNSFITNEEASMLQAIKTKTGAKLINEDARRFKNFMADYSSVTGKSLYNGTLEDVHNSNFLISVGSYLKSDAPAAKYAFNNAITMNKGAGLYFHSLGDTHIEGFGKKGKNIETIINKPLSEDAVLYFILDQFGKDLPADVEEYLASQRETRVKTVTEMIKEKVEETTVDTETGEEKTTTKMVPKKVTKEVEYTYTKLLDMIGADESLLETITTMLLKKDTFNLIVGEDCITHPNSSNIAKLSAMVEKYTNFTVLVIPAQTNSLGVSLLCDLDSEISGKTVGYNVKADYQLSAFTDGDIDMPALNQQEGTFVNIDKKVIPTNAAIGYEGYELNDIANNILETKKENAIDYTSEIFDCVEFDKLENRYGNDMVEYRGYSISLDETKVEDAKVVCEAKSIEIKENEYIIYNGNPINQFNEFTAVANQLKDDIVALYISDSLKTKLEVEVGDKIKINANNSEFTLEIRVDNYLVGDISYVPTFDKIIDTKNLFNASRFSVANLERV
ncbi:MAG: NADH-quinone oxidoreductase subunit G [Campylobacterota bacterium]|nr:NADH-quinone oxidoreductase subunit G [Campylobacterota bacterium]